MNKMINKQIIQSKAKFHNKKIIIKTVSSIILKITFFHLVFSIKRIMNFFIKFFLFVENY